MRVFYIFSTIFSLLLAGCRSDDEPAGHGNITFNFEHVVNDVPVVFDQMIYENAAGNSYEITNIQWFISDLTLIDKIGREHIIGGDDWIHYIDTDLPETHKWKIIQGIEAGDYQAIKFTFGIKGEKNIPDMFTDPPESNMIWPYHMGGDNGGYHYMKLNGFWENLNNERTPFNFHIGVGQIYKDNQEITGFVQNWFEKELPSFSFTLHSGEELQVVFQMNIENWFKNPNVYDHNVYGGKIMDNQEAMGKIKENGTDVFSVYFKNDN